MDSYCIDSVNRRRLHDSDFSSKYAFAEFTRMYFLYCRGGYGRLGRLYRQTLGMAQHSGAFLDPVADKLMVSAALIVLLAFGRVDMLVALVIIGREITVSALREWMARVGESGKVKVNWFGKIKAIAQMVSIPMLLYFDPIGAWNVYLTGTILIYIAAILTIYSMFVYLKAAAPFFSSEPKQK